MCGICGVVTPNHDVREASETIPELVRLMSRRGPDDEGIWSDDRHATFGFRRLSIIDPGPQGHQPMLFGDDHVIVFNGELYNFREIRRELTIAGHSFRTECDTEVVLRSLVVWGRNALEKFNGMFAMAWFDRKKRRLLLARDPLGIKPLYYLLHRDGILFGSQYNQLIRHPWCRGAPIQQDVLGLYLRLGHIPAPYGLLKGTFQLPAGHCLELDANVGRVSRYMEVLSRPSDDLSGEEAVEALGSAVSSAVRRQLVSDVPVGSFLSGGIDSPLVAATALEVQKRLPLFSIGFDDPTLDESDAAIGYAKHLEAEHYLRVFRPGDALARLDEWSSAYSEPFADYSGFPTMLVAEMARERGTKVLLSGDGGDELFWGYPRFRKVLGAAPLFRMPRAARLVAYAANRRSVPRGVLFPSIGDWYLDSHSGLKTKELRRLNPALLSLPLDFDEFAFDGTHPLAVARWMRKNEMGSHLQRILLKVDRASMWFGVEVRVPLLDLEVVRCAERIGPCESMDADSGKAVLRKVAQTRYPSSLIGKNKKGFAMPMEQWLRNELKPLVEDLLLSRDPFPSGLFDKEGLSALHEANIAGAGRSGEKLWTLLSLQLWADKHLKPATRLGL